MRIGDFENTYPRVLESTTIELIELLIQKGADVNAKFGVSMARVAGWAGVERVCVGGGHARLDHIPNKNKTNEISPPLLARGRFGRGPLTEPFGTRGRRP